MAKEIDSKVLLNHLGATAVCVVHAYNHKILYSNDKMKELAEVAEAGENSAVCGLLTARSVLCTKRSRRRRSISLRSEWCFRGANGRMCMPN